MSMSASYQASMLRADMHRRFVKETTSEDVVKAMYRARQAQIRKNRKELIKNIYVKLAKGERLTAYEQSVAKKSIKASLKHLEGQLRIA